MSCIEDNRVVVLKSGALVGYLSYFDGRYGHPSAPTNPIDTSIQKKTNITLPFTIKATKKEYSFRII